MALDPARVKSLFQAAAEIGDDNERAALLDRECAADPDLRVRVDALLEAFLRPMSALDRPIAVPLDVTADYRPIKEGPGTIIGPYKLLQKIGEGGFGVVYMAEQEKPVRRTVALKIIKPGMDTAQVIARFESERQALALMEHPNIAKVLDAVATDSGRPYFVMELVKGLPITEFCDKNHMPAQQRLKLFVDVCHAIQHAHHKGVIHRDIKPTNVLVTLHDGTPVVKVIDFGVAKAIVQKLTERTLFTAFGQMIGTPAYMSPEQAELSGLDIDTRSDVYSLGVLLYELLTGTTPLEVKQLRAAGYAEMQRLIREAEPPKPSTRLSSMGDAATVPAGNRGTDVKKLAQLLSGDLDWIVMKALAKERDRRYTTPGNFAEDIERSLRHEAIAARPPSSVYRLKKLIQRNRAAVATILCVSAALLVGTGVATWQAIRATREEKRAMVALRNVEKARAAEAEQRKRAEMREQQAIDAVKRFGDAVSENPELKNNPTLEPLRKKLLSEPLEFFKRLREQLQAGNDTRSGALARLAQAASDLGRLAGEIGDQQDALRAYEDARALQERLAREHPTVREFQRELARSNIAIGWLLYYTGKHAEALTALERAREIQGRLVDENPSVTEFVHDEALTYSSVGYLQSELGQFEAARSSLANALKGYENIKSELGKDSVFSRGLARAYLRTALLESKMGHVQKALEFHEKALAIRLRLAEEDPENTELARDLAWSYTNKGRIQASLGQKEDGLQTIYQAKAIIERLIQQHPAVTKFRYDLASTCDSIADVLYEIGKLTEALEAFRKAQRLQEDLLRENPTVTEYQSELARSYHGIGALLFQSGRSAEALAAYEKAHEIRDRLAREHPLVTAYQLELGDTCNDMGLLYSEINRRSEAIQSVEHARWIFERVARENPSITQAQSSLSICLINIGNHFRDQGKPAEALAAYRRALEIREKLASQNPSMTQFLDNVAGAHNNIGILLQEKGQREAAAASFHEALVIQKRLVRENPGVASFASSAAATLNNLATIDIEAERFAEARDQLQDAIIWQKQALATNPHNPLFRQFLKNHYANLNIAARGLKDVGLAAEAEHELADLAVSDPKLQELSTRLLEVRGGSVPGDNAERLALARHAYDNRLYALAARLWSEGLVNDPKLADDRQAQYRYNAACAAVLAAASMNTTAEGEGKMSDAERAVLRQKALILLQTELDTWSKLLETENEEQRQRVAKTLHHWRDTDSDLSSVRDEAELAKLPESERVEWKALWKRVDELIAKSTSTEEKRDH